MLWAGNRHPERPLIFMSRTLQAIYHVRSDASSIEDRARAIAVEQSVEMPIEAASERT